MIEEPEIASTDLANHTTAVDIRDLHIDYRVYEEPLFSARQLFGRGFRTRRATTIHAVRGVSIEIQIGEAVGIIGSNGSGKSTLLRAIAGLQSKTSGIVRVRGDVQLLGVGAALKPKLSGYRNVMLGGLAMGLTPHEVETQLPAVTEFSGLGDAMARPMNTYSSGMRARLAFSIATLRIPDVLLIDEALAVGDKDFRTRSLQRINEIRDAAGTVIMVTHNLNEIRQTCHRAIWLSDGIVQADGDVEHVIETYLDN
ncbi:MAG: ATP-binding cassette domain-containing protein [Actinomycetota bacterium]